MSKNGVILNSNKTFVVYNNDSGVLAVLCGNGFIKESGVKYVNYN